MGISGKSSILGIINDAFITLILSPRSSIKPIAFLIMFFICSNCSSGKGTTDTFPSSSIVVGLSTTIATLNLRNSPDCLIVWLMVLSIS